MDFTSYKRVYYCSYMFRISLKFYNGFLMHERRDGGSRKKQTVWQALQWNTAEKQLKNEILDWHRG